MRKTIREYRYNPKNIQILNRAIALVTAGAIGVVGGIVFIRSKNHSNAGDFNQPIRSKSSLKSNDHNTSNNLMGNNYNNEAIPLPIENLTSIQTEAQKPIETEAQTPVPTEVPTPVPTEVPIIKSNGGDSIIATSDVNLRLDSNTDSFKLGYIQKGTVVDRIMSLDDWDLVRIGDTIAYVSSDFTSANDVDYNNEYYSVNECSDIVTTTSALNFRTGPSTKETSLFTLDKGEEAVVIGEAIPYNDSNDVWYIARARGQIGFINAKYTRSFKEEIRAMDPSVEDVVVKMMGYISNDTSLYDQYGNSKTNIGQYQLVEVLDEDANRYLVNYEGKIGYVNKSDIQKLPGKFVAVDLSSQRVFYYVDNDLAYSNRCTTGSDYTPTNEGYFKVYERTNSRYFSETAQARYIWANFDHGNGLHDAPWELENKFGDPSYRKKNGSKGCVRLPDSAAIFFKDHIKVGTRVLVKK